MSVGIAVPAFWLGLVLITVFAVNLGVFPAGGYVPISDGAGEWFLGLALPAAPLAAAPAAALARHTRSAMITVLEQRSEERSVGKECVRPCRSRRSPYPKKKNKKRAKP